MLSNGVASPFTNGLNTVQGPFLSNISAITAPVNAALTSFQTNASPRTAKRSDGKSMFETGQISYEQASVQLVTDEEKEKYINDVNKAKLSVVYPNNPCLYTPSINIHHQYQMIQKMKDKYGQNKDESKEENKTVLAAINRLCPIPAKTLENTRKAKSVGRNNFKLGNETYQ